MVLRSAVDVRLRRVLVMDTIDTMTATHGCGFTGTLAALALHSCQVQESGGRCEDYPACGHTDGDGCQTLPSHTSDFYYRNPHLLHEPGTPEWFDAMDEYEGDEPEWWCPGCGEEFPDRTEVFDNGSKIDNDCVSCRVRNFINNTMRRS
jgi:hypothetical protein